MKTDHLSISNKRIHVNHISMDFSQCGIYLIKGSIGCGKTTLMEELMFGDYPLSFSDPEEAALYRNDRCRLFTYVPQNCCVTSSSVGEYIRKRNRAVTDQAISALFRELELSEQLLHKPFRVLSGGEQVKVAVITGMLKNTPYLFLDEPTNNLDNQTVDLLCKVLTAYAKNRKIIIISHDPRLKLRANAEYIFENGTVKAQVHETVCPPQNPEPAKPQVRKPGFLSMAIQLAMNIPFIAALITTVCLLGCTAFFMHMILQKELVTQKPPEKGYIFAKFSNSYDSILERYVKAENLQIDPARYEQGVPLDQIPALAAAEGVKEIYIHDTKYIDYLDDMIRTGKQSDSMMLFSMPAVWNTDFMELSGIDLGLLLTHGVFPSDQANEVLISKPLLIKYYGYTEENAEQALGKQIRITDTKTGLDADYTVTGFTYFDIAVISYDPDYCYGIYHYTPDTYEAFRQTLSDYLTSIDATPGTAEEVLIQTEPGSERKLLNRMMQEYPANYYYSSVYVQVWAKQFNKILLIRMLLMNLIIAAVSAVILYLLNKNALGNNMQMLTDYGNYYLDRNKIYRLYASVLIGAFLIAAAVCFVLNMRFSSFWRISGLYLIFDAAVIFLPFALALSVKKGGRK